MSTVPQPGSAPGTRPDLASVLMLEFPQSVAIYQTYAEAQKAVDYLSDKEFEVKNLAIVGTDLKTFERVTGRRTWGSVIAQGATSGLFMGLLVGLMLGLFVPGGLLAMLLTGVVFGVGFGILNAALVYGMSRGQRDFESISQTIASRYEVLAEHRVAQQAREMLRTMPGERARQWNTAGATGVVSEASAQQQGAQTTTLPPAASAGQAGPVDRPAQPPYGQQPPYDQPRQ